MSAILSGMLSPERKRSSVVRNLFGPLDDNEREKLHVELDKQEREIDEAERKRFITCWGFDPVKGEPIENGDFECTLMDPKCVPAVYTSVYKRKPSRPSPTNRVRSPCAVRNSFSSAAQRPTKRKLRFDDGHHDTNDENRETTRDVSLIAQQLVKFPRVLDVVSANASSEEFCSTPADVNSSSLTSLTSPPASPHVSSSNPVHCPPSPSVLSSSCPVLDTDSVRHRLEFPIDSFQQLDVADLDLSRVSPDLEYVTPSGRQSGKLVQRVMTDYIPIKKKRVVKASPRS